MAANRSDFMNELAKNGLELIGNLEVYKHGSQAISIADFGTLDLAKLSSTLTAVEWKHFIAGLEGSLVAFEKHKTMYRAMFNFPKYFFDRMDLFETNMQTALIDAVGLYATVYVGREEKGSSKNDVSKEKHYASSSTTTTSSNSSMADHEIEVKSSSTIPRESKSSISSVNAEKIVSELQKYVLQIPNSFSFCASMISESDFGKYLRTSAQVKKMTENLEVFKKLIESKIEILRDSGQYKDNIKDTIDVIGDSVNDALGIVSTIVIVEVDAKEMKGSSFFSPPTKALTAEQMIWHAKFTGLGINDSVVREVIAQDVIKNYDHLYKVLVLQGGGAEKAFKAWQLLLISGEIDAIDRAIQAYKITANTLGFGDLIPMDYVAMSGSFEATKHFVKELKPSRANGGISDGVLLTAALGGSKKVFQYLEGEYGLSVHLPTTSFGTVLHFAAVSGSCDLVEYLVTKHRMDPLKMNESGENILIAATRGDSIEMVLYIIEELEVPSDSSNLNGNTVLHIAASRGALDIMDYALEELEIPFDQTNRFGQDALCVAAYNGRAEAVLSLRKYAADKGMALDLTAAYEWAEKSNDEETMQALFMEVVPENQGSKLKK